MLGGGPASIVAPIPGHVRDRLNEVRTRRRQVGIDVKHWHGVSLPAPYSCRAMRVGFPGGPSCPRCRLRVFEISRRISRARAWAQLATGVFAQSARSKMGIVRSKSCTPRFAILPIVANLRRYDWRRASARCSACGCLRRRLGWPIRCHSELNGTRKYCTYSNDSGHSLKHNRPLP